MTYVSCITQSCFFRTGQCMTQNGTPCVFPWKYHDKPTVYTGCANPDEGTGPWCATQLTDGKYIEDSGTWGYCNMDLCNQEEPATTVPTTTITTSSKLAMP